MRGSVLGATLTLVSTTPGSRASSTARSSRCIWCGLRFLEDPMPALRANLLFWALQAPYVTSPLASDDCSSGARVILAVQSAAPRVLWFLQVGSNVAATLFEARA